MLRQISVVKWMTATERSWVYRMSWRVRDLTVVEQPRDAEQILSVSCTPSVDSDDYPPHCHAQRPTARSLEQRLSKPVDILTSIPPTRSHDLCNVEWRIVGSSKVPRHFTQRAILDLTCLDPLPTSHNTDQTPTPRKVRVSAPFHHTNIAHTY